MLKIRVTRPIFTPSAQHACVTQYVCRMESTTNIIHKMHWKGHGRYNLHTMLFKASGTVKHFTTLFLDGSCSLYYHYCYYYYYYYCYYYYSSCEKL